MANCVQHPEVPAVYYCDGCRQLLCGECIEESHALLLCRLCGERALPLDEEGPANTSELHEERVLTAPYSFQDALFYPFRGTGRYLFVVTLLSFFACWVLSFFCLGGLAYGILWLLIAGLQFKIVRSTAAGDNQLPDWPDFTDFGGLVADLVTWLVINLLQFTPVVFYLFGRAGADPVNRPDPLVALAIAALGWVGTAVALMGFGAAGNYRRMKVLGFHQHFLAYMGSVPDSVHITNYAFGLFVATTFLQSFFEGSLPLLGTILSGVVGLYWIFMMPHLGGLVFRRHNRLMDRIYWPDRVD